MRNTVLGEYRFLINFQNRISGLKRSMIIPAAYINLFMDGIMKLVLKDKHLSFLEPLSRLLPVVTFNETEIEQELLPKGPFNLGGALYIRPAYLSACIVQKQPAMISWLLLEIYDMNKLALSGHLTVQDVFIYLIDIIAESAFSNELLAKEVIYYDLSAMKLDLIVYTLQEEEALVVPSENWVSEGVFEIPQLKKDRSKISFNKIEDRALPSYRPSQFFNTRVNGRGKIVNNRVIIDENIYQELCYTLKLSQTEENGGYLIGNVYRHPDAMENENDPGFQWLVEVTNIVPAEQAFGNSLLLLFTGETWSRVNKRVDQEFPNKKIIGWYHTHLFAASDDFGLSELDQVLHRQFFTKAWQIALLLNIELNGNRELRSFQKNFLNQKLEETKYEILSGQNDVSLAKNIS